MKDLIKDYLSANGEYEDVDIINIDTDQCSPYVTFEYSGKSDYRHRLGMFINIWDVLVFVNDKLY